MNGQSWDERYAEAAASDASVWSLTPNAFIAETVGAWQPGTAVDLGCGEGRNALWLAQRGWQVTGVDFSAVGLATGLRRADELGVEVDWVQADATRWVSPALVDLVVIAYLQLAAVDLRAVVGAAAGWLEPGGRIVLVGHALENLEHGTGGPRDARLLHRLDDLRLAASDLEIEQLQQVLRPVGDRHAIDAVLVARRG